MKIHWDKRGTIAKRAQMPQMQLPCCHVLLLCNWRTPAMEQTILVQFELIAMDRTQLLHVVQILRGLLQ